MERQKTRIKKLLAGICLAVLLSCPAGARDENGLKVDVLAKSISSWDGQILPEYPVGQPEITILKIKIPAGATLPLHEHPVINAGVLVSGKLTVVTEDKKILYLKAGDSIVEVVNTWHYGKNEGDVPAEIIVFYAGVQGEPVTVKR